MSHNLTSTVNSLQFCPYEDVLGVGHGNGFTSLLIPGNLFNPFPACHDSYHMERSGSVIECLTRDRGAAGSSLTVVTALCP